MPKVIASSILIYPPLVHTMKSDEHFLFFNSHEIMSSLMGFTIFLPSKAEVSVGLKQGSSHYPMPGMVITQRYSFLNNSVSKGPCEFAYLPNNINYV